MLGHRRRDLDGQFDGHPGAQPRVSFSPIIDPETADTVEFCLHENTLGVSCQAMQAPVTAAVLIIIGSQVLFLMIVFSFIGPGGV